MLTKSPPENRNNRSPLSTLIGSALATSTVLGMSALPSQAITYNFTGITKNNSDNALNTKLFMDVSLSTSDKNVVLFTISNNSFDQDNNPYQSTISDVYFGAFAGEELFVKDSGQVIHTVDGVNFRLDQKPGNFPDGNSLNPKFNTLYSFFAVHPASQKGDQGNGIDPGEYLTLAFTLSNSLASDSNPLKKVMEALNIPNQGVGVHVTNYKNGKSGSFIDGSTPVPLESDALPVIGATIFVGGGMWLKRRRQANLTFKDSPPDNTNHRQEPPPLLITATNDKKIKTKQN